MRVGEVVGGRDNNFNLIRILAAFAVLVDHSYPLIFGKSDHELLPRALGLSISGIAVDTFFVISGFLVTRSLFLRQDLRDYARARVLRIFPALWVMIILIVFGLGPVITSNSLGQYFSDMYTYRYLFRDSILFTGIRFNLPGVFDHNAYANAVNGSLWTLYFEVRFYMLLAIIWATLTCLVASKNRCSVIFRYIVVGVAVVSAIAYLIVQAKGITGWESIRLSNFFFCGSVLYVFRDRVSLTWTNFIVILVVWGMALALGGPSMLKVFYSLLLGWMVLHLAYIPAGWIRQYNRLGDYSYGMYIYAFPIQQTIVHLYPKIGVPTMIFVAGIVTLILAAMSWHWIEKPALARKQLNFNRLPVLAYKRL